MRSIVSRMRIQSLKQRIEELQLQSVSLVKEFQATEAGSKKSKIAFSYDEVLKRTHALQLKLESLEKKVQARKSKPASTGQGTNASPDNSAASNPSKNRRKTHTGE